MTPATLDFRAVAKVAQRIKLTDIRLRWSQFGRFAESDEIDSDWAGKAFLFFDSWAAIDDGEDELQTDSFPVQCLFQLWYFAELDSEKSGTAPEPNEDNPPDVAIEATFDLFYDLEDRAGITASDLQHFAFANGTHNAWPYWREFAQTTSLRLGLAPYIVGPFKLPSQDDPQVAESKSESEDPGASPG